MKKKPVFNIFYNRVILLILLIIILYISYTLLKKNTCESFYSSDDSVYLFWTGGYDSTFRLCQLVIDQRRSVIPIYITDDNLDNPTGTYRRKNRKYEIDAMNKIKDKIYSKFTYTKDLIKDTIYIDKININSDITQKMNNLYNSGKNHRPMTQYGGLAQTTFDMNKKIEIAVENSPHSTMRKMIFDHLNYDGKEYYTLNIVNLVDKNLEIFKNFLFPTIHITKKEMYTISVKNNYQDILKMTWSCWFPTSDGKPCGNCPMCNDRYV